MFDPGLERLSPERLREHQWRRFRALAAEALGDGERPGNPFVIRKWRAVGIAAAEDLRSWEDLQRLPVTRKAEFVEDQAAHPPFGTNLTYPLDRYIRVHQTSGTSGQPLRWLDTQESWDWWARCWGFVLAGAGEVTGNSITINANAFGVVGGNVNLTGSAVNAAVRNFWQFVAVRAALGVGETIDNPASQSLMADYYPVELRGRAYAYQRVAPTLGTAIGLTPGLAVMSLLGDEAIDLIQEPTLKGVATLVGLMAAAIGISVGLQLFISRRRDRADQTRRPGRRLLRESVS